MASVRAAVGTSCKLCKVHEVLQSSRCSKPHTTWAPAGAPSRTRKQHRTKLRLSASQASKSDSSDKQSSQPSNESPDPNNKPHPIVAHLQSFTKAVAKVFTPSGSEQDGPAWQAQLFRYGLLALFFVTLGRELMVVQHRKAPQEVMYSDFVSLVDAGKVQAARLETASCRLFFDVKAEALVEPEAAVAATAASTLSDSAESPSLATQSAPPIDAMAAKSRARLAKPFYVKLADKNDNFLVPYMVKAGVDFGIIKASFSTSLSQIFLAAMALWLPLIPLFFLVRRVIDARTGQSKRSKKSMNYQRVTFNDVAGVDEAKRELMEVVECLRDSTRYTKLQAKMPSGVLLSGPPGTGKTLLARAVAGEAGVPFMAVSASEFVEMFVGRGAARIRELFAEARKSAPCVVFIDELDAVGGIRGRGWNDERDQTLNQLLTELDGFEGRQGVMLLAATNRVDVLDPALLRPGRISRKVVVPLPDEQGRTEIIGVHLRTVPLSPLEDQEETCRIIARITSGFSGAELANVVNEAALLAARRSQDDVTIRELLEGVRRTKFGVNGRSQVAPDFVQRFQGWLLNKVVSPRKPMSASA